MNHRPVSQAPDLHVAHSLRPTTRDRLGAVECPFNMVDQIGGWLTHGFGHAYGKGYPADILAK